MSHKHDSLCKLLARELDKKPFVKYTGINLIYSLGEVDVKSWQGGRVVYYEVKSNHTWKQYAKAKKQLLRWTKHYHNTRRVEACGVYWTPTKIKYVCRNGILR